MLEWLKRHVWKACDRPKRFQGSNPCLSAESLHCANNQHNTRKFPLNRDKNGTRFSSQIADVVEVCEEKKMCFIQTSARVYIDYIPARLTTGKVWYIHYSVIDPQTRKLRRVRKKVNYIPTRERRAAANQIVADINTRLALGWNPLISAVAPKACEKLSAAFKSFIAVKGKEMEPESLRVYYSYVKIFRDWLAAHGIGDDAYVVNINRTVAMEYMNDIDEDEKKSARTYNNYLKFLQTMFNWMKGKGYVPDNPFDGIKRKPKRLTEKIRRPATNDELSRLCGFLTENNPHYLLAVLLCYGCFIRPKELAMLKCSDIDLARQLVHIRSEVAKNDKDSFRTIPDALMPLLRAADLSHPEWYLFAKHKMYDFTPGPVKVCSRKLSKYWGDHVRCACSLPMEVQFYSLKDTGITNMLEHGVPINTVQRQADHSSVAMTAIYVGHGKGANEDLKSADIFQFGKS